MSLFKRRTSSKTESPLQDDETSEKNIFSHTSRYRNIVADESRLRKEKAQAARKAEPEPTKLKDAGDLNHDIELEKPSATKRRRITSERGSSLLDDIGISLLPDTQVNQEEVATDPGNVGPPKTDTITPSEPPPVSCRRTEPPSVINIDDDDDDGHVQSEPSRTGSNRPPVNTVVEEDSDPEFAELKRQARARRKIQGGAPTATVTSTPQPSIQDPVIALLITSPIPDTEPLMVFRKASQRLQEVREAWCQRQRLPDYIQERIFLTHRLRKVYDSTTCRSLGIDVDPWGRVTIKGSEGEEGGDRLHLEAVTDMIWARMKAERAAEEQQRAMTSAAPEYGEDLPDEEPVAETLCYRISLRAKGRSEPFKLKVHPTTKVSKIISVCRHEFRLAENQSLHLEIDGERLNGDDLVEDTEIEDLICVDVHIK